MFKMTYIKNKFIKEKELTFQEFKIKMEEYFLLNDDIKEVNIRLESSTKKGIAMTFNNHLELQEGLYKCFKVLNNEMLLIEFKEYVQCFTIDKSANVKLDFIHNRMFLEDFNMTIYFNRKN